MRMWPGSVLSSGNTLMCMAATRSTGRNWGVAGGRCVTRTRPMTATMRSEHRPEIAAGWQAAPGGPYGVGRDRYAASRPGRLRTAATLARRVGSGHELVVDLVGVLSGDQVDDVCGQA